MHMGDGHAAMPDTTIRSLPMRSPGSFVGPGGPRGGPQKPCPGVEQPTGMERLVKGAKGLLKAALGTDPAPKETIALRQAICAECDQWTGRKCRKCGCWTGAKIRINSERCPLGKW